MSDPNIDIEIDSGIDKITLDIDSYINQIIIEENIAGIISGNNLTVDIGTGIDEISVDMDLSANQITVEEVIPSIQLIEVGLTGNYSPVTAVNNLVGDVNLTYETSLTYISPVNGEYLYTINHNLGYQNTAVIVYNVDNESVIVEYDCIDENTVVIKSLSNMNNFKVVIQR